MQQGYDPVSAMPPASTRKKFKAVTALLMLVTGGAGSLGSVALFGKGTVNIAPFTMELEVKPAPAGKTRIAIDPGATGLVPGTAEATTHSGPLEFSARVTGVTLQGVDLSSPLAPEKVTRNPRELAGYIREHGRSALRSFGIRVVLVSALGGLIGGMIVGLGNWKRTLITMVLGVLTFGGIGAVAGSTYDINQFENTQWAPTSGPS
jgi:hypothetical protein